MKDHRWESLDPDDASFVDGTLRAGREELPDEARMRALEDRLGSALEKEPPPSGWWSSSRLYPVVGLAVVALGVRAGSSLLSTPSPSVVAATPATPLAVAATELAPTPSVEPSSTESSSGVSVESLPSAEAPHATKVPAMPDAKARPSTATAAAVGTTDELALLEEASRALDASPEKTLSLTDEHMKRFRAPKFAQERERLAVVALVRLGRRDEAKRRADAFEAAFPGSAHLTRIRELVRP